MNTSSKIRTKNSEYVFAVILTSVCLMVTACSGDKKDTEEQPKENVLENRMPNDKSIQYTSEDDDRKDGILARSLVSSLSKVQEHDRTRVVVSLSVTNNTNESKEICKYHTPFEEDLNSDLVFEVLDSKGNNVPYLGRTIKRSAPSRVRGDFIELEPGETIHASINITHSYEFGKGKYRIRFVGARLSGIPSSNYIEVFLE